MSDRGPEAWTKLDRIRYLLDHWQDIFDPSLSSGSSFNGRRGHSGSRSPGCFPAMADNRSVKKVENALTALADREPVLARHLKAYRCNCEWRTTEKWFARKLPSGKQEFAEQRVREKIVPRWVDPKKVTLAETVLLNFVRGDVSIPQDLWLALTKP